MAITYRQGDIMFVEATQAEIEKALGTAQAQVVERKDGRVIVAEGEVTGHHHAVSTQSVEMRTALNMEWLVAPEGAEVVHEEHDTVTLPAGYFWIVRQREYTRGMVRKVID